MIIDRGGKDYQSYRSKQFAQMIQRKNNKRQTHKARAMLLIREVRKGQYDRHQFFRMTLGHLFLSSQMNARKGIKEFGQRAISTMIKEFQQLDQGAFPGKPVVMPVDANMIIWEEKKWQWKQ